jgi:hypothetical protein
MSTVTMSTDAILPSRNRDFGFFGTISVSPLRDRPNDAVWALASTLIAEAVRAESEDDRIGVRDFLDSRMGRHFADDVVGALHAGAGDSETAIGAAIRKWQSWRISRATEREEGIPAGLPYLTGWVQHFAVAAGMAQSD